MNSYPLSLITCYVKSQQTQPGWVWTRAGVGGGRVSTALQHHYKVKTFDMTGKY